MNSQDDEITRCLAAKPISFLNRQLERIDTLRDVEFRVFSQFGEDGIIDWLIHWLKPKNTTFVEFGVSNFTEANCRYLLVNSNWRGLIMDSSKQHIDKIRNDAMYWRHDLSAKQAFITRENIRQLIYQDLRIGKDMGLLSVDINGNDYWILKELADVSAEILIMEVNSIFGDQYELVVPYKEDFDRFDFHHSGLFFGASIKATISLAEELGYAFVGTCSSGINAFFVRQDRFDCIDKRIARKIAWPALHRDSRDENGQLDFVGGKARFELIKDNTVWDCKQGCEVRLGDLEKPFSDDWLRIMG